MMLILVSCCQEKVSLDPFCAIWKWHAYCLLEVTAVATISELLLLIYAYPPPMWEFFYFFYPMKVKKKESRKESGMEKGRERGKKEGKKKEELPHFVFRVYVLKGCLSRFVYSSSFCVLFLPWYLPFLEWFLVLWKDIPWSKI